MNIDSYQEEKLRRGLGLIVTETPPGKEWDELTLPEAAPAVGRRPPGVWMGLAAVLVVLALFSPLLFLSGSEPATTPGGTSSPPADITESTEPARELETTPSTTPKPDAVTEPPAVVSVTEVDTESGYSRFDGEGPVDKVLASTGIAYDEFPDFAPDAAVDNGRVVIVGGNAERVAGIWYSDDGTWVPAKIDFPDGVTVGESDGDMRLADGIKNVETDGRVFVAWEPVQVVDGEEPTSAGTIVFTSSDGANWSATVTATEVAGLIPWNGGYIATYPDRSDDPATWVLGWSFDLTNWVELVDLGQNGAFAVERSDHGVLVRQEAGADGSVDGVIRTTEVALERGD